MVDSLISSSRRQAAPPILATSTPILAVCAPFHVSCTPHITNPGVLKLTSTILNSPSRFSSRIPHLRQTLLIPSHLVTEGLFLSFIVLIKSLHSYRVCPAFRFTCANQSLRRQSELRQPLSSNCPLLRIQLFLSPFTLQCTFHMF